jgi:4-hydroxy-4-methyl-2-oxoglutarate aldolase
MSSVPDEVLEGLKQYDSATLFNAAVKGFGLPNEDYTDHTIRCLLPALGPFLGYAVTAEVTTSDPDSPALEWADYYEVLEQSEGPVVAVLKDVDSRPGRGASFGDGMAALHKRLGAVGVVVEGTVRDLEGIEQVGMPVMGWGRVPGHGQFNLTRVNAPLTVGQMRVRPGDLIFADGDGCFCFAPERAADILRLAAEVRAFETEVHATYEAPDYTVASMRQRGK